MSRFLLQRHVCAVGEFLLLLCAVWRCKVEPKTYTQTCINIQNRHCAYLVDIVCLVSFLDVK